MKVCFVGAGSIGKRHIKNLMDICKDDKPQIHLLRSSYKELEGLEVDIECYSVDELDAYYDMIFITNPTFLHYDTLKALIDKSDCFFVEKPVFDDPDKDYSFVTDDKNVYVACPLRHLEVFGKAKEMIDLGSVIHIRGICSSYLPDWRPGVDYRKVYSASKAAGGGVRIDLIHEWDYITSLFGFPDKIYSLSGTKSSLEIDSEDIAVYIAEYKDKLLELHLDYFGRTARRQLELYTDDHLYVIDIIRGTIEADGKVIYESHEQPNDKYIREMRYFLDLYDDYAENINDIDNAVRVMRVTAE